MKKMISELTDLLRKLPTELAVYEKAVSSIRNAVLSGNKVLIAGNGGSHAQAQHLAAELVVRYKKGGRSEPIAAIALHSDQTVATAACNDYGYASAMGREVEALGKPGDVLIAISTSGDSPNIAQAIAVAEMKDMVTIGLSGLKGMAHPCQIEMRVPSVDTARTQECHLVILHSICEELENA